MQLGRLCSMFRNALEKGIPREQADRLQLMWWTSKSINLSYGRSRTFSSFVSEVSWSDQLLWWRLARSQLEKV